MTPAQMIALLDRQLARNGHTVILRRRVGATDNWTQVVLRGRLTGENPNPLVGSTKQIYQKFILSPTLLTAAIAAGTWPNGNSGPEPKQNDELIGPDGVNRRIEFISAQRPNGIVVRYDGQVLG